MPTEERVCVFLFGSFELKFKDQTVRLPTRKTEALLAYLVLHPAVQNREKIASLFWGDSPIELARRSLRTALAALRKEVGEEFLVTDRETIQLNPKFPLWVDVLEMQRQTKEAEFTTPIDLDLYRGDLLHDFYDDWVLEEREYYHNLIINALLQSAQSQRAAGEYQRVIDIAKKIVSIDPTNERAYQHLIFCYGALGYRSAALKSYEECAHQLQERLGIQPSEDTDALYEQVKKANSGGVNPNTARSNLPIPLTSFIGREHELNTLKELFNKTRLLTLTGVGGCGKTRLSIQLAGQIADPYADGVWWIALASIQDEKLVVQTVKRTLGIADSQSQSPIESILSYLHNKQILLVLDNCEHVISVCASLAESILSQCPNVKILATSREALSIHGEIAWLVPSLSMPPANQAQDILMWESPRLFFERATSYRTDLQLTQTNTESVMRICRALEGIPLALELAAARVKTLSLEQLASRLDDKLSLLTTGSRTAQPRQQTLRAAIDWSYELLSEAEQIALRRLSILAGNWTLEAAESVASLNELSTGTSLDLVSRLFDKSLLGTDAYGEEIRYRMLEIIRQYAFEKLEQADEVEETRDRHLRYYSELAQKANPGWYGKDQAKLIKQFDAEYPNLRVALAWGLEHQQHVTQGIKLASALGPFWNFIAQYSEGRMWLKKTIDATDALLTEAGPESTRRTEILSMKAKVLYEYGFLVWFQSEYDYARLIFQESSEIYRQVGDVTGLAFSNTFLAHSTWGLGERNIARQMWDQACDQLLKAGELWAAGLAHSFRGRAEREAENYDRSEREYAECIRLFGVVGDDWGLGISYSHLGMIAFQKNDAAKAMELFEERLIRARKIGFKQSTAYSIFLIGMAAWKLGDRARMKENMREAMAYFYDLGNQATLAEALLGLAWVAAEEGEFEQAAYLLGTVMKADEAERMRMSFEDIYFHRPIIADLQLKLDHDYHAAIQRGRNATLDQVAREILES